MSRLLWAIVHLAQIWALFLLMHLKSVLVFGLVLASLGNGALSHWSVAFLGKLLLAPVSTAGKFI